MNKHKSPFRDMDGTPIYEGDILRMRSYNGNGADYDAVYRVIVDPESTMDNGFCLEMISGSEKAMALKGPTAFGANDDGKLLKGRIDK